MGAHSVLVYKIDREHEYSSVHILVHSTIAYQPWCPIVIGWNYGAPKTYLETMLRSDGFVILLGVSMVVQSEACTLTMHTSSSNESIPYQWMIIVELLTLKLIWYTTSSCSALS